MVRNEKRRTKDAISQGKTLEHKALLHLLQTPTSRQYATNIPHFHITPRFKDQVERAIREIPDRKSTGTDEVFVESLRPETKMFASFICCIWEQCGKLRFMPTTWRTVRIMPIHKQGDPGDPNNYRPIAIISQMRKVIEKAMDYAVREAYDFHRAQLGFRKGAGTEQAILRNSLLHSKGFAHTAVLDLRKAYDKVPKDRLMQRVKTTLSANLAAMIACSLQPVIAVMET